LGKKDIGMCFCSIGAGLYDACSCYCHGRDRIMNAPLHRKVVLIAGAGRGSGPATARALAAQGHHVVLGGPGSQRMRGLVSEIREAGGSAEWFALDVNVPEQMREFLAFGEDVFKRVDAVINNG
jgi:NAD(P)-dependent dehydrogenase (short-subunit alcohol dehydrogenase family)